MLFITVLLLAFSAIYIGSLIAASIKQRARDEKEFNDIEKLIQDGQRATKNFTGSSARIENEIIK